MITELDKGQVDIESQNSIRTHIGNPSRSGQDVLTMASMLIRGGTQSPSEGDLIMDASEYRQMKDEHDEALASTSGTGTWAGDRLQG